MRGVESAECQAALGARGSLWLPVGPQAQPVGAAGDAGVLYDCEFQALGNRFQVTGHFVRVYRDPGGALAARPGFALEQGDGPLQEGREVKGRWAVAALVAGIDPQPQVIVGRFRLQVIFFQGFGLWLAAGRSCSWSTGGGWRGLKHLQFFLELCNMDII